MKREEFENLVEDAAKTTIEWWLTAEEDQPLAKSVPEAHAAMEARLLVMRAWDAQAAEVDRLRDELDRLRVGVPLTAENAPEARLVECENVFWTRIGWYADHWTRYHYPPLNTAELIERGAIVIAWRKS